MRLTSLAAVLAVLAACSSGSAKDNSYLTLTPSNDSAPADGQTAITITLMAVGMDGTTPFNGQAQISCKKSVLFAGQTQPGEVDTVTITDGNGSVTVTCAPGASCVGTDTISGALVGAEGNSTTVVSFTGPGGTTSGTTGTGTGSATTSSSGSTTGSSSGTTSGTSGAPDGGDGGVPDAGPMDGGPSVGAIATLGTTNKFMGIDYGTSYVKFPVNTFTFEVTDSAGKVPIFNAPVSVTITTSPPPSLLLGAAPKVVGTLVGAPDGGLDGEAIVVNSDANGKVVAQVHSGQTAGTVIVTASVDAGTTVYNVTQASPVIGTQPSLKKSTLSCSPVNLPVYATGNTSLPCETTSAEAYQTICTVNLADRFGQEVQVAVSLQFYSEAGNFANASVETPDFGQTGTGLIAGEAQTSLQTTSNVPVDVTPYSFEPNYTDLDPENQRCGMRTYNPRDGLVTIVALLQGEEAFNDSAATGVYEPGDPFTDMPQPFVDSNDNSTFDTGETCLGSAVAGQCSGPNGTWDANTNLWLETRVLYTGIPGANIDLGTSSQYVQNGSTILFNPTSFNVAEMGQATGDVTFADVNLNYPALDEEASGASSPSTFTTFGAVKSSGPNSLSCTFPAPGAPTFKDTLGMSYVQITEYDAGVVPSDAGGPVPSQVGQLVTHLTQFTGGFGTAFQLSNSNSQPANAGPFTIEVTEQSGSQASASVSGIAE